MTQRPLRGAGGAAVTGATAALPGARTLAGLAGALVPKRKHVVMALLVGAVAVAAGAAAGVAGALGWPGLETTGQRITGVLMVMPLWVLLSGSLTRLSERLVVAWDDTRAALRKRLDHGCAPALWTCRRCAHREVMCQCERSVTDDYCAECGAEMVRDARP